MKPTDSDRRRSQPLEDALGELPLLRLSAARRQRIAAIAAATPQRRAWPRLVAMAACLVLALGASWFTWWRPAPPADRYSAAQIDAARQQARTTLLLTAEVVAAAEKQAVLDVFGEQLPQTLKKSLRTALTPSRGGEG